MAINPQIPLMGQPVTVQAPDLIQPYLQAAQMRRMGQQDQLVGLQLGEAQREASEKQALRDVYARNIQTDPETGETSLNRKVALAEVYKINPQLGMQMEQQEAQGTVARQKMQLEAQKSQLETRKMQMEYMSQASAAILEADTQEAYDQIVAMSEGIVPTQNLPKVYSRAYIQNVHNMSTPEKERLNEQLKNLDIATKAQTLDLAPKKFAADEAHRKEQLAAQREGQRIQMRGQDISAGAQERAAAIQARGAEAAAARQERGMVRAAEIGRTEKPLEGEAATSVAQVDTILDMINDMERLYKPEFVGPIEGRAGALREKYTGEMSPDEVEFRRIVNDVSDTLMRERSGAAVGERKEYDRLLGLSPDLNSPDTVFQPRTQGFKRAMQQFRANKLKVGTTGRQQLREEGPPQATPAPAAARAPEGKIVSRAEADALATRHMKSIEEITADLKAKGYTVE